MADEFDACFSEPAVCEKELRRDLWRQRCLDPLPKLSRRSRCAGDGFRKCAVFIDVDLVSSARACLRHFWPRLAPGGYWYTHEASFPRYVRGLLDPDWWHENLGADPPLIMGAGSGLSPLAASLAYFRKDAGRGSGTAA